MFDSSRNHRDVAHHHNGDGSHHIGSSYHNGDGSHHIGSSHHNGGASHNGASHHQVEHTVHHIEKVLDHNPHDFSHVFKEIDHLRRHDPKHFRADLHEVNKELHAQKYLPHLQIVQDDHSGKHHRAEHGYDIIAKDPSLKHLPGHYTAVSTSHHTPRESSALHHAYHRMQHGNLWNRSLEGGHGADGGYDKNAVGGHVPDGVKKDLIDKALELAGLPATASNEAAVNKIVSRESSWNPNVTNHTDINAERGHPSTGLMQTIPSTFRQYALPGYDSNIHDPLSNLVAGIRYAQARYARGGRSGVEVVASRPGGY
jgi:hypothetical protein